MKPRHLLLFPVFFALAASAALTGCNLNEAPGQYQGVLTEKSASRPTQVRVTATVTVTGPAQLTMAARAPESNRSWTFTLTNYRREGVVFTYEQGRQQISLKPSGDNCYITASATGSAIADTRICLNGQQVLLDLTPAPNQPVLSFVLDHLVTSANMPELEAPAQYAVSQLIQRGMDQSFESQVEFEHVTQARLTSQNAHLNLLPHFTANTLLGLISFNATSLVRSIGDLAPFLLPTRWFKAREAAFKSVAEYDAMVVMKADTGSIVEGLGYAISRDSKSITRMQEHRVSALDVRDLIFERERLGLLPPGSTVDFDAVLNTVDEALLMLNESREGEFTALAQASGFFNPKAIQAVVLDGSASIERPIAINPDQVAAKALDLSFELKQMDALISYARANHAERGFNWLDPSGEAGSAIGFGFGAYLAIGASQVREMIDQRKRLQSVLLQKVANTTNELNNSVTRYALAGKDVSIQTEKIERMLENLRLGIDVSMLALSSALQDQMRADLDRVNAEFAYLVATSKINRLSYEGPYAQVKGLAGRPAP